MKVNMAEFWDVSYPDNTIENINKAIRRSTNKAEALGFKKVKVKVSNAGEGTGRTCVVVWRV